MKKRASFKEMNEMSRQLIFVAKQSAEPKLEVTFIAPHGLEFIVRTAESGMASAKGLTATHRTRSAARQFMLDNAALDWFGPARVMASQEVAQHFPCTALAYVGDRWKSIHSVDQLLQTQRNGYRSGQVSLHRVLNHWNQFVG